MSAAVYCHTDSLSVEEDSKVEKHTEGGYNSQTNSTQQSQGSIQHQLPSIFSVMPGNQSPQVKTEDSISVPASASAQAQALSYFNYPVYYQAPSRRENELSVPYYGTCLPSTASSASQQISTTYLPLNISPQPSYTGPSQLFAPVITKSAPRKTTKSNRADKCVCRRVENHIPRPRNAFILFRQKHHQSVLKEHTNLKTNPEVSRELARRWRTLPKEEKDHWNSLAEDEKKNHARKYPNYRYKPRRNKNSGPCPVCQVKPVERPPTPQHNFAAFQDFPSISMAPDIKVTKSPLISTNPPSLSYQQSSSLAQQQYFQQSQQQQQQQHQQQQVQIQQDPCSMQRYPHYGNYHLQNQYPFGEGLANYATNGHQPHGSSSVSSVSSQQQLNQQHEQQYFLHVQQRSSQPPSLQQSSSSSSSHSQHSQNHLQNHSLPNQGQPNQTLLSQSHSSQPGTGHSQLQLQHPTPNTTSSHNYLVSTSHSAQGLMTGQFSSYAEKYHETPVSGYPCPDSVDQSQKLLSLPTPLASSLYSGAESFSVAASY